MDCLRLSGSVIRAVPCSHCRVIIDHTIIDIFALRPIDYNKETGQCSFFPVIEQMSIYIRDKLVGP